MRLTVRLPGLSPATSQFILHLLAVFATAFVTQIALATGGTGGLGTHSWPTLLALVCAAGTAGLVACIHYLLGLVPNLDATLSQYLGEPYAQVAVSALTVFLTTFGAQLAVGASHVESISTLYALVVAAITAAGSAVIHYVIGLVPVPVVGPTPAPTPVPPTPVASAARKATKTPTKATGRGGSR